MNDDTPTNGPGMILLGFATAAALLGGVAWYAVSAGKTTRVSYHPTRWSKRRSRR